MNVEEALRTAMTGATNEIRNAALNVMIQWKTQNPDEYVRSLASILSTPGKEPAIQQLACTEIKQIFTTQSPNLMDPTLLWWKMSDQTRVSVKNALFNALMIPVVGNTAAIAISPIALIELSRGQWMDLFQAFQKVGMTNEYPPNMVMATLSCISYVVEQAAISARNILTADIVNKLLTVLVYRMGPTPGMDPVSPDGINIRSIATQGMHNLIDYTSNNFANENERFVIMKAVLTNASTQTDPRIKMYAFRCLERVVRRQYKYLNQQVPTDLMNPNNGMTSIIELIFTVTFNQVDFVIQNVISKGEWLYGGEPEGDCALDAVNVWRSLATYEYGLKHPELIVKAESPACENYIQKAIGTLMPKLLMGMCTQVENQENDVQNLASISGVVLRECSRTIGPQIVPHIMSFVSANVASPDWRRADASCLAFGVVVEYGATDIDSYLRDAIVFFVEKALKHPVVVVRESAAWALSVICKYKFEFLYKENMINGLINAFSASFRDDIRVVINICTALYNLTDTSLNKADEMGFPDGDHPLASITKDIITTLLNTLQRPDAQVQQLISNVYECINILILGAPGKLLPVVESLLIQIATDINAAVNAIKSGSAGMQRSLVETRLAHMCGTLNTIISRISYREAAEAALLKKYNTNIAELLIQQIIYSNVVSSNVTVVEEAILALDTLVLAAEDDCFLYAFEALKIAVEVLKHPEHNDTFGAGVGLAGDLVYTVGDQKFASTNAQIYENIVRMTDIAVDLIQKAVDAVHNKSIKLGHSTMNALINALPQFISAKSTILVTKYLDPVMSCITKLTMLCMNYSSDEDDNLTEDEYDDQSAAGGEYESSHSKIQYSLLTAWSYVVMCVIDQGGQYLDKLASNLPGVFEFIKSCYNNGKCTGKNLLNAVTLASDIAYFRPDITKQVLSSGQPWFETMARSAEDFFRNCRNDRDKQVLGQALNIFRSKNIIS